MSNERFEKQSLNYTVYKQQLNATFELEVKRSHSQY